ncbi:hypothetical protein K501DRAFT_275056 [Backusella circina FSU 941]|nr:hypothetical protein K501DRAFT_275056 [Backusella circina FSU 941]
MHIKSSQTLCPVINERTTIQPELLVTKFDDSHKTVIFKPNSYVRWITQYENERFPKYLVTLMILLVRSLMQMETYRLLLMLVQMEVPVRIHLLTIMVVLKPRRFKMFKLLHRNSNIAHVNIPNHKRARNSNYKPPIRGNKSLTEGDVIFDGYNYSSYDYVIFF